MAEYDHPRDSMGVVRAAWRLEREFGLQGQGIPDEDRFRVSRFFVKIRKLAQLGLLDEAVGCRRVRGGGGFGDAA